jgi:hypothetical protein
MGCRKICGDRVSLSKQLGISVSTIIKNHNIIEVNANRCGPMAKMQIKCKQVYRLLQSSST